MTFIGEDFSVVFNLRRHKQEIKMVEISKLKGNAIESVTYDTGLQVCLRIVSFILNAFIVRHVPASVFAIITVRLHLLYSTGLLLSREAFRRSTLGCKMKKDIKKIINLIWMGTGLSLPLSVIGWILWSHVMEAPPTDIRDHYYVGVVLILFSIIIEVSTETPYIIAELQFWTKVKVLIEGLMNLSRALILAAGIHFLPKKAVLIYGISHLVGSVIYSSSYYALFAFKLSKKETAEKLMIGNFFSMFVTFSPGKKWPEVDKDLWIVSLSFLKQGWIKEALTEGELYLMNLLPLISFSEQGVYQVVNNLGSLAARLIFRNVETAAYKFFAQSLKRGTLIKNQEKTKMKEVNKVFESLLKHVMLISFFIVTFGWSYSYLLLHLYGGVNLSILGGSLLRFHSIYIVFMALNGITEAFSFSMMSSDELSKHNYLLFVYSVIYIFVTIISIHFVGVFGLIIGNCTNMILRILHSIYFIRKTFEGSGMNPLKSLHISKRVASSFIAAFFMTYFSEKYVYEYSFGGHLIIGIIILIGTVIRIRREMHEIIIAVFNILDQIYSHIFKINKKIYPPVFETLMVYIREVTYTITHNPNQAVPILVY